MLLDGLKRPKYTMYESLNINAKMEIHLSPNTAPKFETQGCEELYKCVITVTAHC